MLELRVAAGREAGVRHRFSKSPISIGRSPTSDLVLASPGVWDRHAEISLASDGRFEIRALSEGMLVVRNEPVTRTVLKSGDRISVGSVELEFQLAAPSQRGLKGMEAAVWFFAAVGLLSEAVLIFILIR